MPSVIPGLAGLLGGVLVGFLVQRARLCTFGAMEDALMGRDFRRLKVFGLALAVALLLTQGLILAGHLDPDRTTYVPTSLPLAGLVVGGVMFGIGMAFVGTCGFGSLVRLGTGDLRALIVIMVFGVVAYAALRGILAGFRIGIVERIALPMPGPSRSDFPTQIEQLFARDPRQVLGVLIPLGLGALALADRRLRRARRLLSAGIGLGLVVALGWAATAWWSDPFDLHQRPQSLTFVAPVARALFGVLTGQDAWHDFGVASVVGVVVGAMAASLVAREFRWEAFDDHHEMRRHMIGAALMGFGGVLAGGCTIGQGLSAGSLLALSMPVALLAMLAGARLGIAIIMGEAGEWFSRRAS
ncbi:MAG: YeeE/YedE family protein [Proteobacteria bacterium]|nr:YeeE/YedE family protein [Pseudomonadota bacterium]